MTVCCIYVGAYGIRPELRGLAMSRRRFAARLGRRCTGRMPYAPTIRAFSFLYVRTTSSTQPHPLHHTITRVRPLSLPRCCVFRRRRGVWHTPELRGLCNLSGQLAARLGRRCTGRMPYAPTIRAFSFLYVRTTSSTQPHPLHHTITRVRPLSLPRCCVFRRRRGVWHTPLQLARNQYR